MKNVFESNLYNKYSGDFYACIFRTGINFVNVNI